MGDKVHGKQSDPPLEIEDLVELVCGMSRFLRVLTHADAFRSSGISLAEWAALNLLATQGPGSVAKLGTTVGLGGPMAEQLVHALTSGGFVSTTGDGRAREVALTELGRSELERINAVLEAQLAQRMANKGLIVAAANRLVSRHLIRGLRGARTGKPKENGEKDNARDADRA